MHSACPESAAKNVAATQDIENTKIRIGSLCALGSICALYRGSISREDEGVIVFFKKLIDFGVAYKSYFGISSPRNVGL
jgi:hypothetical protein